MKNNETIGDKNMSN